VPKTVKRTTEVIVVDGKEMTREIEEENGSWLETLSSLATFGGILAGLLTAVAAIVSYEEQSNKDLAARAFEAKKPFFEKQMTFYVDAMETVSKLANSDAPEAGVVDHFWEIYWGRLAAVEDTQVDRAMVIFGKKLNAKVPKVCLQQVSLLLAHCVKKSWADTWQVTLDIPPELPCTGDSFAAVERCTQDKEGPR